MLITGLLFIRLIHVILSFDRVLADAVDDDMRMDISGVVAAVCVGDNHCLIAGEILPGKVQTKLLRPFPGEPALGHICRVEADDVVMAFQFTLLTVFLKLLIWHSISKVSGLQLSPSLKNSSRKMFCPSSLRRISPVFSSCWNSR